MKKSTPARHLVCLIVFAGAFSLLQPVRSFAFSGGTSGWCGPVPGGGVHCSASAAAECAWQFSTWAWSDATYNGYEISANWSNAACKWTRGPSGGPAGSEASFSCASNYTYAQSGICVRDNEYTIIPTTDRCGTFNNGGQTSARTGRPIDLVTGAKLFDVVDFRTADGSLLLERYYNSRSYSGSRNETQSIPIGLGINWKFSFQHEIQLNHSTGARAELETADGGSYAFDKDSSGSDMIPHPAAIGPRYQTDYTLAFVGTWPSDPADVLLSSSQWRVTDPEDRVWIFQTFQDPATGTYRVGRPISVTFRGGLQWTFTYGSHNELTAIEDSYGKTLSFTWILRDFTAIGGTGIYPNVISKVTLPDSTTLNYIYDSAAGYSGGIDDSDRLIKVEHRDASNNLLDSTTYLYENANVPWAVTGVEDSNGTRRWTVAYDSDGHATVSKGPSNANETDVVYGTVGSPSYTRTTTNALGKNTVYTFNWGSDTHLDSIDGVASTNCPASAKSYSYSNYFISSVTDEEGRVTQYTRNSLGQPTQIIDGYGTPSARTTSITWHSTLHVPTQVVQPGLTTDYTWNSSGQLTQVTQTDTTSQSVPYSTNGQTRTWTFTYNSYGYLLTVDGPLSGTGDTVTYTYDSSGYLASVTNELNQTMTVSAVNGRGQPTTIVDPGGVTYALTYDSEGRFKSMTVDPSGVSATTTIDYNAVGDVTKVTRPNGAYLQYTYDDASRLTKIEDNSGGYVEFDRDGLGNATARRIKNSGGTALLSQTATFDELGRLLTLVGAASQTWTYAYDKTSNRISVTDPRSGVYSWGFDSLNRLISETDQDSGVITLTRNGTDKITNYNDPRSLDTGYVRDGFGDVIQRTSPDSGTTVYVYNALGEPTQITDGRGIVTELTYDDAGRLLTKQYPADTSENITYTWDVTAGGNNGVGRLTKIEDASGSVEWTYNVLGQVTQEKKTTASIVYTIGYAYDLDGNVTQITYPSGRTVSYSRAANGTVADVTTKKDSGSASVTLASSVAYLPFGPLTSLTYGNGLELTKSYTQDYLIAGEQVLDPSTSTYILNRTYAFGDGVNLTAITDDRTAPSPTPGSTGNDYSYPGTNNKLASIAQGVTTVRSFSYDGAGNITADTRGSTTYNYRYNKRGRLDQLTIGSTVTADYTYDGLERLAVRTTQNMTPAGTTHYLYDLSGHLLVEADDTGQTLREYVWLDNMPLAVVSDVDTGSPNLYYVHADQIDTPVRMTDASKAVVWDAFYLPFGGVQSITGSAINNLRFPGQYFLIEDGLHYNWYRHYDPTLGRYTRPDPLGFVDGPSVYAYARSAPIQYIDRDGRFGFPWLAAGFAGADLVWQLYRNDWNWSCVNPWEIAEAALWGLGLNRAAWLGLRAIRAAGPVRNIAPQIAKIENQLAQHGRASVERSLRSLERRLAEHQQALETYKNQGGYTSSIEREIRAFEAEIKAIRDILGRAP
jgi:RHS repeat-associated protein